MAITINLIKGSGYVKQEDLSKYATNSIIACMDKLTGSTIDTYVEDKTDCGGCFIVSTGDDTIETSISGATKKYYSVQYGNLKKENNKMVFDGDKINVGFICDLSENVESLHGNKSNVSFKITSMLSKDNYIYCSKSKETAAEENKNSVMYFDYNDGSKYYKCYIYTESKEDNGDLIGIVKNSRNITATKPGMSNGMPILFKYKPFDISKWQNKWINYEYLVSCLDERTTTLSWTIKRDDTTSSQSIKLQTLTSAFHTDDTNRINGTISVSNKNPRIGDNVIVTIIPNEGYAASITKLENCTKIDEEGVFFGKAVATLDIIDENPSFEVTFSNIDTINLTIETAQLNTTKASTLTSVSNDYATKLALNTTNDNIMNVAKNALNYPTDIEVDLNSLKSFDKCPKQITLSLSTDIIEISGTTYSLRLFKLTGENTAEEIPIPKGVGDEPKIVNVLSGNLIYAGLFAASSNTSLNTNFTPIIVSSNGMAITVSKELTVKKDNTTVNITLNVSSVLITPQVSDSTITISFKNKN